MNIFKKLTLKNIKLNRKRVIATVIGITLSTALICATFGLATSFQKTLLSDAIKSNGDYHATFKGVPKDEQKYITENRNVESYFITQDVGYSKNERVTDNDRGNQYWYLMGFNNSALKNGGINLTSGRLPQNENEVIIQERTNDYVKDAYKIGDKITLNFGERYSLETGEKLGQEDSYSLSEDRKSSLEELRLNGETRELTIVGITKRFNTEIEPHSSPALTIITYLDNKNIGDNVNISVKFTDVSQTYKLIDELGKNYEVVTNNQVLRYSGLSKNEGVNSMIFGLVTIIVGIIVFSSVFVIKNSFQIMITEKNKQYGMFASIGATSKQIKKNILYEGFILGLIAIPLGILGSIIAVYILILIVQNLMNGFVDFQMEFYFSWQAILLGIVVSAITIYLSCIIPARKAAKISPIEAIRSNQDVKINKKKIKTPKLIKKIFKIGGVISYKNLKRSKKQYRTTVVSIVVSVAIFIALSAVMRYMFEFTDIYYYNNLGYNIQVSAQAMDEQKELEIYDQVSKYENIEKSDVQRRGFVEIDKSKFYGNMAGNYSSSSTDTIILPVIAIGDSYYNELAKELGLDENEAKNGAILSDKVKYYSDGKYTYVNSLNIKEGETLNCYRQEGADNEGNPIKVPIEINITKRLEDYTAFGITNDNYNSFLITSQKYLQDKFPNNMVNGMYIQSNNPDQLAKDLANIENINVTNFNDFIKETEAMRTIIYIFVYGFITVIILIGVTNIFNTITTNMVLRSKEFAMLKSIGMTKREFNSMVELESLFYGLKALIIGIPIGVLLSYWMYTMFTNTMNTPYIFPIDSILIATVFVFLIVFITMKYSLNKINKQNIIDTIRNDNI